MFSALVVRICTASPHQSLAHCAQERVGDAYQLYFLEDQESKPVAVVVPSDASQPPPTALPEVNFAMSGIKPKFFLDGHQEVLFRVCPNFAKIVKSNVSRWTVTTSQRSEFLHRYLSKLSIGLHVQWPLACVFILIGHVHRPKACF